jgi:hypothetical protein
MIHCPKCGAANRRGSRFCNECGEPLPMRTALRCPMCGTMNSVGNVYCDKCQARLIPMASSPSAEAEAAPGPPSAPIKGLSLPTIPLEAPPEQPAGEAAISAEAEAEPDWLADMRGQVPVEEAAPEAGDDWLSQFRGADVPEPGPPVATEAPVETEAMPDWLADMRGQAPVGEAAPEAGDDWLSQFRGADVPEPGPTVTTEAPVETEATPDWLADVRGQAPVEEAAPEAGGDWLSQLRGADVPEAGPSVAAETPVEAEAMPDWLADMRGQAPVEEAAPEAGDDWLSQLRGADVPEAGPPVTTEAPVETEATPDWLADIQGPAPVEEAVPGAGDDWLSQLRGADVPEAGPPVATEAPVDEVEIPDWLLDMGAAGAEAGPMPVEEPTVEIAPPTASPAVEPLPEELAPAMTEVPDWLQEITPEAAPPVTEPMAEVAPVEVPDWLQEIAPEAAPPAVEPVAEATPVEVPDWLQEITPEAAPPAAEPMAEAAAPSLAETPGWLQEIAPEAAPPAAEPEAEAAAPSLAETPDWLQEIAPEAAYPAAGPVLEEAAPSLAEVPDWLQEVEQEAVPSAVAPPLPPPVVEPGVPAVSETPDWLRDIAAEEEIAPQAAPVIPPRAQMPAGPALAEEGLEWLAELEAESGPAPAAPAVPAFEPPPVSIPTGAEGLARAELPAWMESLRPRGPEAEAVADAPVETTGLLEGLRGVLAPVFAVEVTRAAEDVVPAEVREASLSRAQLFQSLLAQPAEAPEVEPGEPRPRIGEQIQRWLVMVVLLVVAAALVVPQIEGLGISLPTLTQPAKYTGDTKRMDLWRLGGMYNAIQGLDAGAGETVLVAFEYGPAEADELDLVADPILRHLLDQGAYLSIVTTRPEGRPVADRLLGDIVASGTYTETQYEVADYRPGDAAGVAQLLVAADTTPSLVLVLTAQPGRLRWWVEQIGAQGKDALSIVAGVGAALEPVASPYLDIGAGQLEGAVVGLSGAAAYERVRGRPGQATERLNALLVGHGAVVGLMIIGAVIYAPSALRRRKK